MAVTNQNRAGCTVLSDNSQGDFTAPNFSACCLWL